MSLTEDSSNATYQIKSIFPGKIRVNDHILTSSFIISPEKLITDWKPTNIETLNDSDLMLLLTFHADIILLGTGEKSVILPAKKLACLHQQKMQVECMITAAACRTYTLLIAEKRNIVAGMVI